MEIYERGRQPMIVDDGVFSDDGEFGDMRYCNTVLCIRTTRQST